MKYKLFTILTCITYFDALAANVDSLIESVELITIHRDETCASHKKKCHKIIEYPLAWPDAVAGAGTTHEFTFDPHDKNIIWVTGDTNDYIARVTTHGKADFFAMPAGSTPHGIIYDKKGQLWVTLEGLGLVVRVDRKGQIVESIDVNIPIEGEAPLNPGPHGLCVGLDGKTLWFTGKEGNTVGKINPHDRSVEQFFLPTPNSKPIFIAAGPDNRMWCTELTGNNIARITQEGEITEFPIPTPNSRPIVIVPGPDKKTMWFSEETGNNVARITLEEGHITEFPVPLTQPNVILAGLAFDHKGNLWVQSYVNENDPEPLGPDHIVKFDKSIIYARNGNISCVPLVYYEVPSRQSVLHRIKEGPDHKMWFTEMATNIIAKLNID